MNAIAVNPVRRGLLACALLAPLSQVAHAAAAVDYAELIDMAGRQRMLTQRIVKAYCQIGLDAQPDAGRTQLSGALQRFEAQLAELRRRAPNAAVREALQRVVAPWQRFRLAAGGAVTREGAQRLTAQGEQVLERAHAAVLALERSSGTRQARLVNISGRQRMLSQRLAKLYMLRAWGLETPAMRREMNTVAAEFDRALQTLRAARENTPAIGAELEGVAVQWEWFMGALELQGGESHAAVVADASETILQGLELVTGLYAQLARR